MPGHRISTRPCEQHVRIEHDGELIAETTRAVQLDETGLPARVYLPPEDVRAELQPSDTRTHCPFKGDATYRSLPGVPDAFWIYEAPDKPDAEPITGMLAPDPSKLTITVG